MKKGFTLIELLAVIVILAIIALIATPIVLNIINDSKESATLRSADFYLDAVEFAVAQSTLNNQNIQDGTYNIIEDGHICLEYDTDNKCTSTLEVQVDGEVPGGGIVTIESGKIDDIQLLYNGKKIVKNDESKLVFSAGKACSLTDDKDNDGIADTGDIITCSTESFHVMSNDGTTISMLAQFNLDVGGIFDNTTSEYNKITNPTGIQSENAIGANSNSPRSYGVDFFSINSYWYDSSINSYIVDANYAEEGREYPFVYGDYKDSEGRQQNKIYPYVKAYEEYLISKNVKSATATLISYDQLIDLGCAGNGVSSCAASEYSWTYSTSYWTGSVCDGYDLWFVSSNGNFYNSYYSYGGSFGVRPVVNISISDI